MDLDTERYFRRNFPMTYLYQVFKKEEVRVDEGATHYLRDYNAPFIFEGLWMEITPAGIFCLKDNRRVGQYNFTLDDKLELFTYSES